MPRKTSRPALLAVLAATFAAPAAGAQEAAPRCDPDSFRAARAAGDSEGNDGADVVVVRDRSEVRVEDNGRAHVVRTRLLKALTETGAAQLAVLRFDYDPATSLVEIRRAERLRADGGCDAIPVDAAEDLPQPAWSIYWGLRMKLLPVPRPAVGDAIETETYFTGFQIAYLDQPQEEERFVPPMRGHFYDTILFGDEPWPVLEKSYAVETPRDKPLQFETYGPPVSVSSTFDDDSFHYVLDRKSVV